MVNINEAMKYEQEKQNAIKALLDRQNRESNAVNKACIDELTKQTPQKLYYPVGLIRGFLALFYASDKDADGRLSVQEFIESQLPNPQNFKTQEEFNRAQQSADNWAQWIQKAMQTADITHDQRLTLGEFFILGFLKEDRETDYRGAKKLD